MKTEQRFMLTVIPTTTTTETLTTTMEIIPIISTATTTIRTIISRKRLRLKEGILNVVNGGTRLRIARHTNLEDLKDAAIIAVLLIIWKRNLARKRKMKNVATCEKTILLTKIMKAIIQEAVLKYPMHLWQKLKNLLKIILKIRYEGYSIFHTKIKISMK